MQSNSENEDFKAALKDDMDAVALLASAVDAMTLVQNKNGYRATFLGLSESKAGQACERLRNRNISCDIISPG